MNYKLLIITSIFIVIIVVIINVLIFIKMERNDRIYYINTNSTHATKTSYYNPSDLGYGNMQILRTEKIRTFEEIKRFVNAPRTAKVILNSGSTESIASCINWAKKYNKYGKIYGTSFDHSSIMKNAKNQDMEYEEINKDISNVNNASAIFITHVSGRTGEINDEKILNIGRRFVSIQEAQNEFDLEHEDRVIPFKPLIFLDATQSITKIPVDMVKMNVNALFFSLHKIGGPMNMGILVINEPTDKPFIPLIAGEQNDELRGGTFNETEFVQNRDIFKHNSKPETRMKHWEEIVGRLESKNISVVHPKNPHLYNTILIDTKKKSCPLAIVNALANEDIYVGTISACKNEETMRKMGEVTPESIIDGGNPGNEDTEDRFIRLSFDNIRDIDEKCIDKICSILEKIE